MKRRALVSGLLVLIGCGGGEGPPVSVREVVVSATSTTVLVGASTQLTARVTGVDGQIVHGAQVTWSSVTSSVIGVSVTGLATGLAAGQGKVRASYGGRSGDVEITVVNPPVASVTFDKDSTVLLLPSGSATLAPIARDASGRVIPNPTFFFASDAPKVATVSPIGVVTAVAAGTAIVSASTEGLTATMRVRVTANVTPSSPRITSVTPLVAGGSAVVSGENFAASVGGNAVLVEGVAATVTAASTTQLTVTLPATGWACDVVRPVALQVNANNQTGIATASLRTAVQRTLAVGQSLVLSNAADARCNELSVSGGAYLVTAYNTARTISGNEASFTLRGAAVAAAQSVALTARAPRAVSPAGTPPSLTSYPRIGSPQFARWQDEARRRHADATHADILQRSLDFARRQGAPSAAVRRLRSLTDEGVTMVRARANQIATVGAVTQLKIPNLDASSFCSQFLSIGARTAWVGKHAVIVEDTVSVINGVPTLRGQMDSLYAQIGQEFDDVDWPILTQYFGNPSVFDASLSPAYAGIVVMVFSPRINTMAGGTLSGFVASCDFYPASQAPSSNNGKFFYAVMPTSLAAGVGAGSRGSWLREIRGTIIHEVKHITSFAWRLSQNTAFEELWLEEGTARHAEEQLARALEGTTWKGNADYRSSLYCEIRPEDATCGGRPILMLRHFDNLYQYLQAPDIYTMFGRTGIADATFYGTSWSIVRWMIDHYATSESSFLLPLVQSTKSGVANLEARVSGHIWEEMYGEWALALYADDYPGVTFANGRLKFSSWNTRDVFAGLCADLGPCTNPASTKNLYPVAYPFTPRRVPFGAFSTTVSALAAGSFSSWLISGSQAAPQLLDLRGAAGGDPPGQVRLAIVRIQ